jgi:hypothetical protein
MVHGSTFDMKDCQTNFPINVDAAVTCGLDYLAIGDTHGFRFVPPSRLHPPTIYPGTPEPTAFDEKDPGSVAVVFVNRQRRATVKAERVAHWTWEDKHVTSLEQLTDLARRTDLGARVLRLCIEMTLPAPDYEIASKLLEGLVGTEARHATVGILELDRQGLELDTSNVDAFCTDLPDVLQSVVRRLKTDAEDPGKRPAAQRALFHLYRMSQKKVA